MNKYIVIENDPSFVLDTFVRNILKVKSDISITTSSGDIIKIEQENRFSGTTGAITFGDSTEFGDNVKNISYIKTPISSSDVILLAKLSRSITDDKAQNIYNSISPPLSFQAYENNNKNKARYKFNKLLEIFPKLKYHINDIFQFD